MFGILFHINQFIYLIELEYPLKVLNKRTQITLPIISLIEVKHPLKISNKRTHM